MTFYYVRIRDLEQWKRLEEDWVDDVDETPLARLCERGEEEKGPRPIDGVVMVKGVDGDLHCIISTVRSDQWLRKRFAAVFTEATAGASYQISKATLSVEQVFAFCYQGANKYTQEPLAIHTGSWAAHKTLLSEFFSSHDSAGEILSSGMWGSIEGVTPVELTTEQLALRQQVPGEELVDEGGVKTQRVLTIPCFMTERNYLHLCYWGLRSQQPPLGAVPRSRGGQSGFHNAFHVVPITYKQMHDPAFLAAAFLRMF